MRSWCTTLAASMLLTTCGLVAGRVAAQSEVATLVSATGGTEVQRGSTGDWQPALVGAAVFVSDRVRTAPHAASKILFRDDSVLDLAGGTELVVNRYNVDHKVQERRALLRVISGKLRALVSGYYARSRARYEVETPTAVVRAQSTEFIVQYNTAETYTDVIGLENEVQVQGTLGVIGPAVKVGPGQLTRVQQGKFPSPPSALNEEAMARYEQGLEITGTGSRDTLDVGHAVVSARLVRVGDRPEAVARGAAAPAGRGSAESYVDTPPPGETLGERMSPDSRTNTQPLLEYRAAPPGEAPTGKVEVEF